MTQDEWFATWFDSPYYQLLYAHRDEDEAGGFISSLHDFLHEALKALPHPHRALDLACGRGRHVAALVELGYDVTGVDLSLRNIEAARSLNLPRAEFETHDMRRLPYQAQFHLVLNLFTSFGYFEDPKDEAAVLTGVRRALIASGFFVLDYLNPAFVLKTLTPHEEIIQEGVRFEIKRTEEDERVVKRITVQGRHFTESVRLIPPEELIALLTKHGFTIVARWGDYRQASFDADHSPRHILIARAD